ncbi:right-handed parallel beta-helix repeat-containing protein [Halioxenophilus aromaticivorans]|uniref:right-handed parallel beta-helix repeat-containing protein n=2 Tax=Halioxenophilus aromaticivorans TaxID=1306992 RepID=UPI0036F20A80
MALGVREVIVKGCFFAGSVCALLSVPIVEAATISHSGSIFVDTTWSSSDTHIVTGDVTVQAGTTLTVEPGTTIQFQALSDDQGGGSESSRPELIVEGDLVALGTQAAPIVLTSNAANPAAGDWGGIHQNGGDVSLAYTTVQYSTVGLEYSAEGGVITSVSISDSTIADTTGAGITASASSSAVVTLDVQNTALNNIGGTGIYGWSTTAGSLTATITDSQLQTVGGHGVDLSPQDSDSNTNLTVTVTGSTLGAIALDGFRFGSPNGYSRGLHSITAINNTLSNIGDNGIWVYYLDEVSLEDNDLSGVGEYGIYLFKYGSATEGDVTILGNSLDTSGRGGIYSYFVNTSSQHIASHLIDNNTVLNATGTGIYVYNQLYTEALSVSGNSVNGAASNGRGIDLIIQNYTQQSVQVNDNEVQGAERAGLVITQNNSETNSPPLIRGNRVFNNGSDGSYTGLSLSWDSNSQVPELSLNEVFNNSGYGIGVTSAGGVSVVYNSVYDNNTAGGTGSDVGHGLWLDAGGVARVHQNRIEGSTGYGLYNSSAVAVAADHNWWGSTITSEMASGNNPKNISGVYDIYDDGSKGAVSYLPWLAATVSISDAPISWVRLPTDGSELKGPNVLIEGSASAAAGIDRVEVSTDNGVTWQVADGTVNWTYAWAPTADGVYQLRSRVVTLDGQLEVASAGNAVTIDSSLPTTSGVLTGDETWSNTVQITGDITVPVGTTLTVEPGTTIQFQALSDDQGGGSESSRPELIVEGDLVALGTQAAPIVLTSNAASPAAGDWGGIHQNGGDVSLAYTTVQYSTVGLEYSAEGGVITSVSISDSTIADTTGAGITASASSSAVVTLDVQNTALNNIGGTGIYGWSTTAGSLTATITDSQLQTVGGHGVDLSPQDSDSNTNLTVTVTGSTLGAIALDGFRFGSPNGYSRGLHSITAINNTLSNIGDNGIWVYYLDEVSLEDNDLSGVGEYGIYLFKYGSATEGDVTILGNSLDTSGRGGIYSYFVNTSSQHIASHLIDNNTVLNATGTGIYVYNQLYTEALSVSGNSVNGAASNGRGIDLIIQNYTQQSVQVNDNEVQGAERAGLVITQNNSETNSPPLIRGNRVFNNGSDGSYTGLSLSWDSNSQVPELSLNEVFNNSGYGIGVTSAGGVSVVYNSVYDNNTAGGTGSDVGHGLWLDAGGVARVHQNRIEGSTGYGLYNSSAVAVAADHNWWGSTITSEMASGNNPKNISGVYDIYDDGSKGAVSYLPWLAATVSISDAPISWVRLPTDGSELKGPNVLIEGSASAAAGIDRVEVSTDNGVTWQVADGTVNWTYAWAPTADGVYQLRSRVVTLDGQLEVASAGNAVTIDSSLPTTSGVLTGDETWSNTVQITGDITVPVGTTLTVEPGTTIQFQALSDDQGGGSESSRPELIVEGDLVALGTQAAPIVLTSNAASPAAGDWGGIHQNGGDVSLAYTTVQYSTVGLEYSAEGGVITSVSISDSTIADTTGAGITASASSSAVVTLDVQNTALNNIGGTGIYGWSTTAGSLTATITDSQLQTVGGHGVDLSPQDSDSNTNLTVTVTGSTLGAIALDGFRFGSPNGYSRGLHSITAINNTLSNIGDNGIWVYYLDEVSLEDNDLSGVGEYGIYLFKYGSATEGDVTILGNSLDTSGRGGIYSYFVNTSSQHIASHLIDNNTVLNATGTGIYVYNQLYTEALSVSGNSVNGAASNGRGIDLIIQNYTQQSVQVNDNEVQGAERAGLVITQNNSETNSPPLIRGNRVFNNGSDGSYTGLSLSWDSNSQVPELSLNEVFNNSGYGIGVTSAGGVSVVYNSVYDNNTAGGTGSDVGHGLWLDAGGVARVHQNRIEGSTGYGLYNSSAVAVAADHNWWGSTITSEMASGNNPKNISGVYDIYDDGSKGAVSYLPWLAATVSISDAPISWVRLPTDGSELKGPNVLIEGSASAAAGIDRVEVSTDNGVTWQVADGTVNWTYAWAPTADGVYQLRSRVVTLDGQLEVASAGNAVTIDSSLPTTSGVLTGDETWSNTVQITGDITVPVGTTLTVEPGTTIQFQALSDDQGGGSESSRPELIVEGDLVALGTQAAPIVLTSNAASPAAGDWGGIHQNGGDVSLAYTTVQYSTVGLEYSAEGGVITSVSISDSTIADTTGAGITASASNSAVVTLDVQNTSLSNIGGTGIYGWSTTAGSLTATITDSQLQTVGGHGVDLSPQDSDSNTNLTVTVTGSTLGAIALDGFRFGSPNGYSRGLHSITAINNTLSNIGDNGIWVYYLDEVSLEDNDLSGVGEYGIYLFKYGSATEGDVTILGNSLDTSGRGGIYSYFVNTSSQHIASHLIDNNTVLNATGTGIYVYNQLYTEALSVSGNSVNGAASNGRGIDLIIQNYTQQSVQVNDNEVQGAERAGLVITQNNSETNSPPLIRGNRVFNNGSDGSYTGLSLSWDSNSQVPELSLNEVFNNSGYGIGVTSAGGVSVVYNSVYDNNTAGGTGSDVGHGLWLDAGGVARVHQNRIEGSTGYGLYNSSAVAVAADHNWWGSTITSEMASGNNPKNISGVYDIYDDGSKGAVSYLPWLAATVSISDAPISWVRLPTDGSELKGPNVLIEGSASAAAGIDRVEVSTDNGVTWQVADGTVNWTYAWAPTADGVYQLRSRVVTLDGQLEVASAGNAVTISNASTIITAGSLSEDQTWSETVNLSGDITVPAGITLTIEAGANIIIPSRSDSSFGGNNSNSTEIIVEGNLLINGTIANPVVLAPNQSPLNPGDWEGIRVSGNLDVNYADVEYAVNGITCIADGAVGFCNIENTTVTNSSENGVLLDALNGGQLTASIVANEFHTNAAFGVSGTVQNADSVLDVYLESNIVSSNAGGGIYLSAEDSGAMLLADVASNVIESNSSYGIYVVTRDYSASAIDIKDNEVANNVNANGITIYNSNRVGAESEHIIRGNNILGNRYNGILYYNENYSSVSPAISSNTVQNNLEAGMYIYNTSGINELLPGISANTITNNEIGLRIQPTAAISITNNELYDNSDFDLQNDSSFAINAQQNWWGIDTTNTLESGNHPRDINVIYDGYDAASLGTVDYSNWLNDFELPATPVIDPITTPVQSDSQLISGTKQAETGIQVNGVTVVPVDNATSWSATVNLAESLNNFSVTAINTIGLISEAENVLITRDTLPPRILSSSPADGASLNQSISKVLVSLYDVSTEVDMPVALSSASITRQGVVVTGSWAASGARLEFTPQQALQNGSYSVALTLTDSPLGNSASAEFAFTIDTVLPSAITVDPVLTPTNIQLLSLSGTKEANSSVWINDSQVVALDDSTLWSASYSLQAGSNSLVVESRDLAGNPSPAVEIEVVLDQTVPQVESVQPEDQSYLTSAPSSVIVVISDDLAGIDIEATIASASVSAAGGPIAGDWSATQSDQLEFIPLQQPLAEGDYTVALLVQDLAGNAQSFQSQFSYDATAPPTPTIDPVTSPTNSAMQTLSGTKEAGSGIRINGTDVITPNDGTSWSYQYALVNGLNTLSVTAYDLAANESAPIIVEIIYNDTSPPPVETLRVNANGTGQQISLDWSGYDESLHGDIAGYRIYIETALFTQVNSLDPVAELPAGTYNYTADNLVEGVDVYIAVVAFDSNGNQNVSATPVLATPADTAAPEDVTNTSLEVFDDHLLLSWEPSINSADDLTAYNVYIDGVGPVSLDPSVSQYDFTGLTTATAYQLRVSTVDDNGNESPGVTVDAATLLPNPEGLSASSLSGIIDLSWLPVAPTELVQHYAIYAEPTQFTTVEGLTPKLIVNANSTTSRVAGLTNNIEYFFAVTTVNIAGGERSNVATVSATPLADVGGPLLSNFSFNSTALVDGVTISGNGVLSVSASDDSGMSRVEFAVNGTTISVDTNGSDGYTASLVVSQFDDGAIILSATAYDSFANAATISVAAELDLLAPATPVITSPANNIVTNLTNITLEGTAEPASSVFVYRDTVQLAGPFAVNDSGQFTAQANLLEGPNNLSVAAQNRGGLSSRSAIVIVTSDSSLPEAPGSVDAQSQPLGEIILQWLPSTSDNVSGYDIYRAAAVFDDIGSATKINSTLVSATGYTDLPPADGQYYYAVVAVNEVGSSGPLSNLTSAVSDSTAPLATSISYTPLGMYDAATERFGVGIVEVAVEVSEPLLATPFLALTVSGGVPNNVVLSQASSQLYTGQFEITENNHSGIAYAVFSARDETGNRGTEVEAGESLLIDVQGPIAQGLTILPDGPIKNSSANPTVISFYFDLDAPLPTGEEPQITYLLSAPGRTESAAIPLVQESTLRWSGELTLPNDAGLNQVETLQFLFSAVDDLNNEGSVIEGLSTLQVYQGELPPLAIPENFTAEALPGGQVQLSWNAVEGAETYHIYRQAPGESSLSAYQRSAGEAYVDSPAVDGEYRYSLASIRTSNSDEALSGQSDEAIVTADRVAPSAPTGLALELLGSGVNAQWDVSADPDTVGYALYRGATAIGNVAGLAPIVEAIEENRTIDSLPLETEPYYAVTALDGAGNQSSPSNSAYVNTDLLPVANLEVTQLDNELPVISWSHTSASINLFNVHLDASGERINLTPGATSLTSFVDVGYDGGDRSYVVTAVDANGVSSIERILNLPDADITTADDIYIERGVMNRQSFVVQNNGNQLLENAVLQVDLGDRLHISESFSLVPGVTEQIDVILGGYDDLEVLPELTASLINTQTTGEISKTERTLSAITGDGQLTLEVEVIQLTRGGAGQVRLVVHNTSAVETDIVTARFAGTLDSDDIQVFLRDTDGNVLSVAPFKQLFGTRLFALADGTSVVRIPPGASFTSEPIEIQVPPSAPDDVEVEVNIAQIHYQFGTDQQVSLQGMSSTVDAALVDTPYNCTINSATPGSQLLVPNQSADVVITGTAVDAETQSAIGSVPVKLVIDNRGFERVVEIYANSDGVYSYTFTSQPGEAGQYSVSCIHPDLDAHPRQAEFAMQSIRLSPGNASINGYIDEVIEIPYEATSGVAASATNLRLAIVAEDQVNGLLPSGIALTLPAPVTMGSEDAVSLPVTVAVDNTVSPAGSFVLRLLSDESGNQALAKATVNYQYAAKPGEPPLPDAFPVIDLENTVTETGVNRGDTVIETLTISNIGLATLEQVKLALIDSSGAEVSNGWAYISSPTDIGTIGIGETSLVEVGFAPSTAIAEGVYQYKVRISSANHPVADALFVVSVTQSGVGGVLFRLSDIYTATLDENGEPIPGLAGAEIQLQNERVLTIDQTATTDGNGEALFTGLASGWYTFRAGANKHEQAVGRIQIKPGITQSEEVFLDYNLITVDWSVTEISIEDRYEITLTATFETDVPAPVVVIEPTSVNLPKMEPGDVFNGEFTITNYGLIRADNVTMPFNSSDGYFRYEALIDIPDTLEAKQRITVPYRVVSLAPLDPAIAGTGGGGFCYGHSECFEECHDYECANGVVTGGCSSMCFSIAYGDCGNPSSSGGGGGASGGGGGGIIGYGPRWFRSGVGGPGGRGSGVPDFSFQPAPNPIDDIPFCPPDCKDGECCDQPGNGDSPAGEPPEEKEPPPCPAPGGAPADECN